MADIDFGVSVRRMACATVLCVRGEVDGATAPALRTAITENLRGGPGVLVIDLSAVTFLASASLLALIEATAAGGHGVRVVAAGRECVRPIRLTGLDNVLSMHGTLAEALN